mmetsp:Transcript_19591/g.35971  ORF Transcript_19591/g.35971 Transcript_19591/m.35971 type:complete len:1576 (-) Transcript_19591:43-4770(-)
MAFVCKLDGKSGALPSGCKEHFVYRLELNSKVQFQVESGTLINTRETEFVIDLGKYISDEARWVRLPGYWTSFGHWVVDVDFNIAGSFCFYVEYGTDKQKASENWILVYPRLEVGSTEIPFNGIVMQTVLPRSLGDYNRWYDVIAEQAALGYNFIHFAPIQELGLSHSHYSIEDHLALSSDLFPGLETEAQKQTALQDVLARLDKELGVGAIVDVVLNHISVGSRVIEEHPEYTYNLENSPHLRVAYELDKALDNFSKDIGMCKVPQYTSGAQIRSEQDLSAIIRILKNDVLPRLKLNEFFLADVGNVSDHFREAGVEPVTEELKLLAQSKGLDRAVFQHLLIGEGETRLGLRFDSGRLKDLMQHMNIPEGKWESEIRSLVGKLNSANQARYESDVTEILRNIEGDIRFYKLEKKDFTICERNPLVRRYFTELGNGHAAAYNGFIMENKNVLEDFAGRGTWFYFRRSLVIWADCVKLRYGECKEDCAGLWMRMENYLCNMALAFKGIRMDNAHGTPIQVSSHLLEVARAANPNLLVVAELFTSDPKLDRLFVNKLGINGLIRESVHAWNPRQLSGMVYSFGNGESFCLGYLEESDVINDSLLSRTRKDTRWKLTATPLPGVFYDCTHDNETPSQTRTAADALPTSAVIAFTNTASASTRGYDELLPQNLSVVDEYRLYKVTEQKVEVPTFRLLSAGDDGVSIAVHFDDGGRPYSSVEFRGSWDDWKEGIHLALVSPGVFAGVLVFPQSSARKAYSAKFVLNGRDWVCGSSLPQERDALGYINNVLTVEPSDFIPMVHQDITQAKAVLNSLHKTMAIEGYNEMHVHMASEDVMMVIRQNPDTLKSYILIARSAFCSGGQETVSDLRLPGTLKSVEFISQLTVPHQHFETNPDFINGLSGKLTVSNSLNRYANKTFLPNEGIDRLDFFDIPQAFVCIIKVGPSEQISESLTSLHDVYDFLDNPDLSSSVLADLSLDHINHLLWRCSEEEKDITRNTRDCYGVPRHHAFVYAGIGGLVAEFKPLIRANLIGHPIFDNIRAGHWLIDYHILRVTSYPFPDAFKEMFVKAFSSLKILPVGVVCKHFVKLVMIIYRSVKLHLVLNLYKKGPIFISSNDHLSEDLGLAVTQFIGKVPSARTHMTEWSISAGLPHFSTGYMRAWGRDTFIAFRGLLLATGLFEEAKMVLLTFASTMRHGLIPNLLDGGNSCRYNARDATWFFMQALQDYIRLSQEGAEILKTEVEMRFKSDHFEEHSRINDKVKLTLGTIVQSIMQQHAIGINFREWNAGIRIDGNMTENGFDVNIKLDKETGFIHGGNRFNCGTWMDKMGSSERAHNRGVPATPRDGAAIELVGLLYSAVKFLEELHEQGLFHSEGVMINESKLSYKHWAKTIKQAFEPQFWIPLETGRISGYYKDTVGSEIHEADAKLRPNQCIAMAVAPDLFDGNHCIVALEIIEKHLLPDIEQNQIGVRTLNKEDPWYRPVYDNSNDSSDFSVAHGFSYHNGPEWLWLLGYFIRAKLNFGDRDPQVAGKYIRSSRAYMAETLWCSLPELTNAEGKKCPFSCESQAWSIGTLLDVYLDLS